MLAWSWCAGVSGATGRISRAYLKNDQNRSQISAGAVIWRSREVAISSASLGLLVGRVVEQLHVVAVVQ